MRFQLRHFFGLAVSVLFVFCVSYGTGNDARAQTGPKTISVFPDNASKTARDKVIAGADGSLTATDDNVSCGLTGTRKSPMACTVQELVDLADPGDTVMFKPAPSGDDPNVYDDVGEILVTRNGDNDATAAPAVETITIRGMGSGDDMITFTGKVMFNVKTSNIVIRSFKFKDTEPPDVATMRATAGTTARAATKTVQYGLSGKTIPEYLAIPNIKNNLDGTGWTATDALTPANINTNQQILIHGEVSFLLKGTTGTTRANSTLRDIFWSDYRYVTIPEGLNLVGQGELSTASGSPISGYARVGRRVYEQALPVFSALNAMGTVWIDSASSSNTEACADANRTNVQVRNNVFENTYLAGVKAGNHSIQEMFFIRSGYAGGPFIPGNNCTAQVEIIGNTFMNVGGNGPFLRRGDSAIMDGNMNKIADVGNHEAAISFSNVTSAGTGAAAVSSKISHNTISGGTYDAIIVMNTPASAKVEISRNNIAASILNGIHILGPTGTADGLVIPTADITVEGNRIWGGSSNRFLTKAFWGAAGEDEGFNVVVDPKFYNPASNIVFKRSAPPNSGRSFRDDVVRSCKGIVRNVSDDSPPAVTFSGASEILKNIMPEVWKSNVPNFPWPPSGAPKSIINADGVLQFDIPAESFTPITGATNAARADSTLAAQDLIRYRADRCNDLGRIRVVNQKGVTIDNNDLGYVMDASGVSLPLSPDNGVVMSGTGVVPKSFEGNNIAFYKEFAVLSDAGFSVAKNYLGVADNWRVGSGVTGADNNGGEPFEPSDEREIGPDPDIMMPDEEPPALVESGDGAPAVNESGTTLTLTFNDMLDATSKPAVGAFEVRAGTTALLPVTAVSISGSTVVLTLGAAARRGETVTVTYTKPASNAIMDDAGNDLESFTATVVTNNITATDDPDDPEDPRPAAASTDGGCALASAGSGAGLGAIVLLLGAVSFAFGLGRKAKAE